ncbi:MAG: hypothetical protein ACK4TA_16785 [Saprospiraceae bacterium]
MKPFILIIILLFNIITACSIHKHRVSKLENKVRQLAAFNKDILQFAGVELFQFNFNNIPLDKTLLVYVKEYFNQNNIHIDTIFNAETTFYDFTSDTTWQKTPIETIGIYTQREFETAENLYLQVRISGVIGAKRKIKIRPEFNELHSWRPIESTSIELNKETPLLLYGASWDDILNGIKVKRFCTAGTLQTDLSDPEILKIPHYYLICVKIQ